MRVTWEQFAAYCVGVVGVLTAIGLIYRMFLRPVVTEVRSLCAWFRKFQRDWDGEPEAPGRDRVPGVMERLNTIDGELTRNGGESLKDQVVETRLDLAAIDSRVDTVEQRVADIQSMLNAKVGV